MIKEETIDKALTLIIELTESDPSFMCDKIMENEKERRTCESQCESFDKDCLMRYLNIYKYGEL